MPLPSSRTLWILPCLLWSLGSPAISSDSSHPHRTDDKDWTGLLGSGLLTLKDASTLPPGRFTLGFTVDNRDRDPLGLDLFDGATAWAVGLGQRTETYGHFVLSRVVSVPELPALPPPPLDIIVAPGAAAPERPLYSIYTRTPFVNKRGTARFSEWVKGDGVAGLKHRWRDAYMGGPALAARFEVKFPLARSLEALQSGAGTGGVDLSGGLMAEWRLGRHALVLSGGYTRVGGAAEGDRLIRFDSASAATIEELPLRLRDRVDLGAGFRWVLSRKLAAVTEATYTFEVGGGSEIIDSHGPLDVLAGFQARLGHFRAAAALRYYANALGSGDLRHTPFPGAVDLTTVSPAGLARYLAAIGAGSAGVDPTSGRQLLVIDPPGGVPLPAGARVVPATYGIRSEHQVGFTLLLGWAF